MTRQLQPHDVPINKPFNHLVRKHYDTWSNKDNHILTPSGKIKESVTVSNSGVDIKIFERSVSQYYSKIILKHCLCTAEDGTREDTFGTTVSKVARVHHLQQTNVRLKDHCAQNGTGAGFLRVLRLPLPILIPPTAPHSSSSGAW
jgi:hypothetical protein